MQPAARCSSPTAARSSRVSFITILLLARAKLYIYIYRVRAYIINKGRRQIRKKKKNGKKKRVLISALVIYVYTYSRPGSWRRCFAAFRGTAMQRNVLHVSGDYIYCIIIIYKYIHAATACREGKSIAIIMCTNAAPASRCGSRFSR